MPESHDSGKYSLRTFIVQLETISKNLDALKRYQDQSNVSIAGINKDLQYGKENSDKLEKRLEDLRDQVSEIRSKVSVDFQKDLGEIEKLRQKIKALANEIDQIVDMVKENSDSIKDHQDRILKIETSSSENKETWGNILAVVGAISGLGGTIAAIIALFS